MFSNHFGQTKFLKEEFISGNDTLRFRVLYPMNFNKNEKYPILFFLHGAGERGSDNTLQLTHGASFFESDSIMENFPAVVIFPQCPEEDYWSNVFRSTDSSGKRHFDFREDEEPTKAMTLFLELIESFSRKKYADLSRIYIAGISMGAMGTFEAVRRKPNLFAAAIAICGGAHPATANQIAHIPFRIYHGSKDNVVIPEHSRRVVAALRAARGEVVYTEFPEANHNSWTPAFADPELMHWLFEKRK